MPDLRISYNFASMLHVTINNIFDHQVEFDSQTGKFIANEKSFDIDLVEIKNGSFHILKNNVSYNADVVEADYVAKTFIIKINGNNYKVAVKDKFDALLHDLGMDRAGSTKTVEIKAPMPGMVLDIRVVIGQEVKKGDPVIVLEAMKMENILKSPSDGIVKNISVAKGDKVEKNTVLVNFA